MEAKTGGAHKAAVGAAGKVGRGGEKEPRRGRRALAPEVLVVGLLGTMALLVFSFGGGVSRMSIAPPTTELARKPAAAASPVLQHAASGRHESDDKPASSSPQHHDQDDRLLGGLLSPAFDDEQTCRSRYALSSLYRRASPFRPSPYLVERLRRYEARHRRCGPGSPAFKDAVEHLRSGRNAAQPSDSGCQYAVWTPFNGLGNRMLALASTFLYALLTDRVLLVHAPQEFDGLFCDPFPGSSWTLPADFPITDFDGTFVMSSLASYKNMKRSGVVSGDGLNATAETLPPYVFLDLIQSYTDAAFCEADQRVLARFNWMVVKSDVYFATPLFLMPAYGRVLERLFPETEAVFHHLARYLFHPSNDVWGIVRRLHGTYHAGTDERIGLQVRVFPEWPVPFEIMYQQIMRCSEQEGLLPKVAPKDGAASAARNSTAVLPPDSTKKKLTSILVTSLSPDYYERIRGVYRNNRTESGRHVAVHQPSHEGAQHTEARGHNQRALAEIYLLSFCDRILTTAVSTFGYVAHGLAGVRPLVLIRSPQPEMPAEPACVRSASVEPCLQAPPAQVCGAAEGRDIGALVPYVRHCEDVYRGVKLFSSRGDLFV